MRVAPECLSVRSNCACRLQQYYEYTVQAEPAPRVKKRTGRRHASKCTRSQLHVCLRISGCPACAAVEWDQTLGNCNGEAPPQRMESVSAASRDLPPSHAHRNAKPPAHLCVPVFRALPPQPATGTSMQLLVRVYRLTSARGRIALGK